MAQSNYTTTVAIDANTRYFTFIPRNGVVHSVRSYGGALFNTEFFDKFKLAVKDFVMENPANGVRKISAITIHCLTDTTKIPNMKGGTNEENF